MTHQAKTITFNSILYRDDIRKNSYSLGLLQKTLNTCLFNAKVILNQAIHFGHSPKNNPLREYGR